MPDISDLTLEEKAALTSGLDFWRLKAIERLGIPSIMVTDGPHGLRKQAGESDHLGLNAAVPATCFPPAVGLGASWDPALAERVGAAIGREAAIEDVAVVLGPGVNIKRSVLCGRNFEYFSEDPIHASDMGSGIVRGIQSQGVGTSLKHFAANNQETDRMRVSSDVDPRPLREIYLRAFQGVVEDTQPWTVMCSYNRVNGVYASEDPFLLTEVLREEWGFEGLVVSDWGASNVRTEGIKAGMDLEMPSSNGLSDRQLVAAVKAGELDEADLDRAAERVLNLIRRANERAAVSEALDVDAHHALAREAAGRSIVLLKNEGPILPLRPEQKVAVIGEFAEKPRYQGGGSSHITPTRVDVALDAIREVAGSEVAYAPGYVLPEAPEGIGMSGGKSPKPAAEVLEKLRAEAVAVAKDADIALVFVGLPDEDESEGFDREHIDLPAEHLALVDAVSDANPNTVVVLSNGGVVALPFADRVPAIVESWLLGQAGGSGVADVLYGAVNPSGRLAESFPYRLEDTPAFTSFPGEGQHVRYGEGLYVGYRWYDARKMDVAFPFGHGLSYTSFAYGDAAARWTDEGIAISVDVTNTGSVAGREVVQAYVSVPGSAVDRAPRELKAFASVELQPGETATVELLARRRDLRYWEERVQAWVLESGDYVVEVGSSSRELHTSATVAVAGDQLVIPLTRDASVGDAFAHPVAGPVARAEIASSPFGAIMMDGDELSPMGRDMPLSRLVSFGVPVELVTRILEAGK